MAKINSPTTTGSSREGSPSDLLIKSQAAAMLGIKVRTLDDWRASRVIPCIQRGHYVRFLRKDLENFLTSHRVEAKPRPAFRRRGASAAEATAV